MSDAPKPGIIGHRASWVSEVCMPDPSLKKCEHFAEAAERYTLTTEFWSETHSMATGYWRSRSSHSCKACLPDGTKVLGL
jgi:hypothetical protein